jgi:hypothetical protein
MIVCVLLLVAPSLVPAADSAGTLVVNEEWARGGRNELGIFAGVASGGGDVGPGLGLRYEYRLSRRFGIGGLVELTGADSRDGVVGLPFFWHVREELKVLAAPGVEFEPDGSSTSALVRVGGEYGFEMTRGWKVAPGLFVDFGDETVVVYGLTFTLGF